MDPDTRLKSLGPGSELKQGEECEPGFKNLGSGSEIPCCQNTVTTEVFDFILYLLTLNRLASLSNVKPTFFKDRLLSFS